jgi:hypothetical protein
LLSIFPTGPDRVPFLTPSLGSHDHFTCKYITRKNCLTVSHTLVKRQAEFDIKMTRGGW